jgi:hypothetical protein
MGMHREPSGRGVLNTNEQEEHRKRPHPDPVSQAAGILMLFRNSQQFSNMSLVPLMENRAIDKFGVFMRAQFDKCVLNKSFVTYVESVRRIKARFQAEFAMKKVILDKDIKRRFYEYIEEKKKPAIGKKAKSNKKGGKKGDKKGQKKDLLKKLDKLKDAGDLDACIDKLSLMAMRFFTMMHAQRTRFLTCHSMQDSLANDKSLSEKERSNIDSQKQWLLKKIHLQQPEVEKWCDLLVAEEKYKRELMSYLDVIMRNPETCNLRTVNAMRSFYMSQDLVEAIMIKHVLNTKSNEKKVAKAFEDYERSRLLYASDLRAKIKEKYGKV